MEQAIHSFGLQREALGLETIRYQMRIYVLLKGKHNRAGDMVDNIPGSICDALVHAKAITNDSAMWAPGAIYELEWSNEPPTGFVAIAPWLRLAESNDQLIEILEYCGHSGAGQQLKPPPLKSEDGPQNKSKSVLLSRADAF